MADQAVRRIGGAALPVVLVGFVLLTTGWLAVGALAAAARYWPGFHDLLLVADNRWAQGLLDGADRSEPAGQAVLDYLLSLFNLVVAAALWWTGRRDAATRLLTIALVATAGAVNLQAHASVSVLHTALGVNISWWHVLLLHGVGGVAYVLALVLFPTGRWDRIGPTSWLARAAVGVAVVGVLALLALSTADYPHTISFVVFFGVLVPVVGFVVQRNRARTGPTPEMRRESRLLCAALAVALFVIFVLSVVTALLWLLGAPGLTLFDPTAHVPGRPFDEPLAVVFWPARLIFAVIPCALIVVTRRSAPWETEHLFSRASVHTLVVLFVGSAAIVVAAAGVALVGTAVGVLAAAVVAALLFQPVRDRTEKLVERLVFGRRPASSAVLEQVSELSGGRDHPDLTGLAEVVARGLGAAFCELTLRVPGGVERFRWPADLAELPEPVSLAVRYGGAEVGALVVDRTSVTDVPGQRDRLLDDLVGILGPVLHNSRLGLELEDQLRITLRRAEEIATSRRRATADMDSERRALERNLHDGAQHHLVALRMGVGLVEHEITHDRGGSARDRLDHLLEQLEGTRRVLADTAAGVFPVVLADHGLTAALTAEFGTGESTVVLDVDEAVARRRFPLDVETAVYFTCLEAVNNAFKHAPGATVRVTIRDEYRGVSFSVADDGPGFSTSGDDAGHGLHNIADRTGRVGGRAADGALGAEPGHRRRGLHSALTCSRPSQVRATPREISRTCLGTNGFSARSRQRVSCAPATRRISGGAVPIGRASRVQGSRPAAPSSRAAPLRSASESAMLLLRNNSMSSISNSSCALPWICSRSNINSARRGSSAGSSRTATSNAPNTSRARCTSSVIGTLACRMSAISW
ncbi:sensor histidine kinase [Saccharopolyspora sp. 5N708]|uniref:sensor histidine kinase n=1 Tax=Saccharopolyspora sp. 5N708 TaxID=3457424 RepID=UPI003FCFC174